MNLQRAWYFVQVGPLDPRAQKMPLPDELMGRLSSYVVAHEVGHTLGFQTHEASSTYPQEKVRDKRLECTRWARALHHGLRALRLRGSARRPRRPSKTLCPNRSV